jgi:chemotaxis protein methyltransferase CheR
MTDSTPVVDLEALSARLREDDQAFRRSFALGPLAAADGDAAQLPRVPAADGGDQRARLVALIEARTGIETGGGSSGGDRLDRLLAEMPAALVPVWLKALEAEPADSPGWEALIACLTVQETYFFRDPDQLTFLRHEVLAGLVAARRHERTARLLCWCAGCATGEEVYSLAILIVEVLREAGEAGIRPDGSLFVHPRWRIVVLGTDIDRTVLRQAREGWYLDFAMGPFRSWPATFAGYLETVADGAPAVPVPPSAARPTLRRICPEIRVFSSFLPFNLNQPEPPVLQADLVLCRNVLIYLSDRGREHAQRLFHRALGRDGHLALGPTDTLKTPELFQPRWGPDTVLYRKR